MSEGLSWTLKGKGSRSIHISQHMENYIRTWEITQKVIPQLLLLQKGIVFFCLTKLN